MNVLSVLSASRQIKHTAAAVGQHRRILKQQQQHQPLLGKLHEQQPQWISFYKSLNVVKMCAEPCGEGTASEWTRAEDEEEEREEGEMCARNENSNRWSASVLAHFAAKVQFADQQKPVRLKGAPKFPLSLLVTLSWKELKEKLISQHPLIMTTAAANR